MKIQIDTTAKTIRVDEQVKLIDLFSIVKKLLPNDEWKQYSLEQSAIYQWWNPIQIDWNYKPILEWNISPATYESSILNFEVSN